MAPKTGRFVLRDNSLSVAFVALFAVSLVGQAISGVAAYNEDVRSLGLAPMDIGRYVTSSHFAVDLSENWQSEYLQFTLYILLTVWLVQRGSSESKKPEETGRESDEDQLVGDYARSDSPSWVKAGGWRTRIYSHSLSLVMVTIFALSWVAQGLTGHVAHHEERIREVIRPLGLGEYLSGPDFWSRTLQNWQSEMLAIASMAVFAVYLRERGSPESKPVGAAHGETTSSE